MLSSLTAVFADVPDPRRDTQNKWHKLTDILTLATCAVIAGAESWEEIAEYSEAKEAFFRRFLTLENGIPSHDTFNRVFAKLDPEAFADRFGQWMRLACEATGLLHIAIDGKSVRRSPQDTFTGCLHVVEAWAVENRLLLGMRAVPEGGHEITTIPDLLAVLDLKKAVVTIDAAGCQTAILQHIRDRGGDYLVTVKGNQPTLHEAVAGLFDEAGENAFADCQMVSTAEDGHGRHEERYVSVLKNPKGLPEGWTGVNAVVMVGRERRVGGKSASSVHYYLTSLKCGAKKLAGYIRRHWGIENGLHWCLDVIFREDQSRTRSGHAQANLGLLRRVALALLKRTATDKKRSTVPTRRFRAACDDEYMLKVLQALAEK
jgi:predicted transposase YbfD/YdcC